MVYLNDKAFIFFGGTESSNMFSSYDPAFLTTIKSLHRLRDDEVKLAQELKIQIVKVGKSDNYAAWAKQSRISNSPIEQLRLLNGDYPDGELQPGQLVKQVR